MMINSRLPGPRARAGQAKDSLYRRNLSDDDIRILAQAARRRGLRDEANYLRLLLVRAHNEGNQERILAILPVLARIEEAQSRIEKRQPAAPKDDLDDVITALTQLVGGAAQSPSPRGNSGNPNSAKAE